MKFRVFINHGVEGPYEIAELKKLPYFSPGLLVCPDDEYDWQPASSYPSLVPPAQPVVTEAADPEQPRNWRQSVIGGDIPEMRYQAYRPPPSGKTSPSAMPPVAPAKSSTKMGKFLKAFSKKLQRQRKALLMGALWTIAIGIYCPQTDNLLAIYQGIEYPTEVVPLGRLPWKHHHPARKPWKPLLPRRFILSHHTTPPADTQAEIASDDLGDGTILKTYVIVHYRNGIRTEETKTAIVKKHKRKHHRVSLLEYDPVEGLL